MTGPRATSPSDPDAIAHVLAANANPAPWTAEYEALYGALIDAGKRWATEQAPAGELRRWREHLKPLLRPYLSHASGDLRAAAVGTAAVYWGDPEYRDLAHRLSVEDADEEVRLWATTGWAGYYRGARDPGVLRALAERLEDRSESPIVRPRLMRGSSKWPATWTRSAPSKRRPC